MAGKKLDKLKLMVVDDELDNLDVLYRTFWKDFKVYKANSATEALAILEKEGEMAVIISDQTPWLGLEEKGIGWDIGLDQPDLFIKAIETAADMDQETYTRMSEAAFDYAAAFTRNPEVLEANLKLFGI